MLNIGILGASGSIGTQTIEILRNNKDKYKLVSFSVGQNIDYANKLIQEFDTIKCISVQNEEDISKIENFNGQIYHGIDGLIKVSTHKDISLLLTAIVGMIGLIPTIEAIKSNKDIALANKETLVVAGHIIRPLVKEYNVNILPVDSEHSAIFQCLQAIDNKDLKSITLTASGGSFRDKSLKELKGVGVDEALNHPNWSMGKKITIDSSTMVNKGLEVIEAHYLFNIDYDNIEVLIHKESIIHSMIECNDGSYIAQLGTPDMKLPIQYALTYPRHSNLESNKRLRLKDIKSLSFEEPDYTRFECLDLAFKVGKMGNSMPLVYNSSNEEAVSLFLENKIEYLEIINIIKEYVSKYSNNIIKDPTVEQLITLDNEIRQEIRGKYTC
ncbi:MAG: 1-deoxy-D-xylulose-5-phosphate reductoisomerase [Mycoplasmatales bacterium]